MNMHAKTPGAVLDPITLSVIQNGLQQVCNEMDLAFCRSAFSPVISEGMDRSDGIYARDDGALIAQGELGLPVFVGTMQDSARAVIERVRANGWTVDAGDVFIVNDPYLGGTHLMDVRFVKPFFAFLVTGIALLHEFLFKHFLTGAAVSKSALSQQQKKRLY